MPVLQDGALAGQRAIVSGSGSGIGRAIANRFVELGAHVVGIGRRAEKLEETKATCANPTHFTWATCDVRNHLELTSTIDSLCSTAGLDILVNNAGGQFIAPATSITPNGWRSVLELNLDAIFWACRAAYPYLRRNGGGSIVNIVLSGVERGSMGMAHSVSARAGTVGLSRTLAQEWGPEKIRVNCVGPGLVLTPNYASEANSTVVNRLIKETPLMRATTADEVAELVAFIASDGGAMITGQLLQLDGGASLSHGLHMIDQELR